MSTGKPRVVKDYDKLDVSIQEQIKLEYPYGFEDNLVTFTNAEGKRVSALPFETAEKYYLVRMTVEEAQARFEELRFPERVELKQQGKYLNVTRWL